MFLRKKESEEKDGVAEEDFRRTDIIYKKYYYNRKGFPSHFEHKNQDCSKSVNSFDSGPIFEPSLGHKLSRNAFVVSILFPERISYWSKGSGYESKKYKISAIFEVRRNRIGMR